MRRAGRALVLCLCFVFSDLSGTPSCGRARRAGPAWGAAPGRRGRRGLERRVGCDVGARDWGRSLCCAPHARVWCDKGLAAAGSRGCVLGWVGGGGGCRKHELQSGGAACAAAATRGPEAASWSQQGAARRAPAGCPGAAAGSGRWRAGRRQARGLRPPARGRPGRAGRTPPCLGRRALLERLARRPEARGQRPAHTARGRPRGPPAASISSQEQMPLHNTTQMEGCKTGLVVKGQTGRKIDMKRGGGTGKQHVVPGGTGRGAEGKGPPHVGRHRGMGAMAACGHTLAHARHLHQRAHGTRSPRACRAPPPTRPPTPDHPQQQQPRLTRWCGRRPLDAWPAGWRGSGWPLPRRRAPLRWPTPPGSARAGSRPRQTRRQWRWQTRCRRP